MQYQESQQPPSTPSYVTLLLLSLLIFIQSTDQIYPLLNCRDKTNQWQDNRGEWKESRRREHNVSITNHPLLSRLPPLQPLLYHPSPLPAPSPQNLLTTPQMEKMRQPLTIYFTSPKMTSSTLPPLPLTSPCFSPPRLPSLLLIHLHNSLKLSSTNPRIPLFNLPTFNPPISSPQQLFNPHLPLHSTFLPLVETLPLILLGYLLPLSPPILLFMFRHSKAHLHPSPFPV